MESKAEINWTHFMAGQDMIWNQMPDCWEDGAFLGNGILGTLVYLNQNHHGLILELGRSDVYDNRDPMACGMDMMYEMPRLPLGKLELKTRGTILGLQMRLDLYHAIVRGVLTTDCGQVSFSSYVHAVKERIYAQTEDCKEEHSHWELIPALSQSPRQSYAIHHQDAKRRQPDYQPNPAPRLMEQEGIHHSVQTLSHGAGFVISWKEEITPHLRTLTVGVWNGTNWKTCLDDAHTQMKEDKGLEFGRHCGWWETYYQQSFLSIPDKKMERFYWAQMYKAASATRSEYQVLDNQGPWLVETAWPGTWWNLNVQLAYSPLYTANRLSVSESLPNQLKKHRRELIENVPEEYRHDSAAIHTITGATFRSPVPEMGENGSEDFAEFGNLTWALHNCYRYYRMTMKEDFLREFLYPMLKRSIGYYLHFLSMEPDGQYHLPRSSSPEYRVHCTDCNYDLSLLKWGLKTLIESADRLRLKEECLHIWKDVESRLTDHPMDEDGFYIGRNVKYSYSHRHYSHLLMIYPLHLVNPDQGNRELIERSLSWWQSMPEALLGYSYTGAASICATLGDGSRALGYLEHLWSSFLKPNTMYRESGPVIETPLAAAETLQEMLLQSWGNKVRIFPAMPPQWKSASFQSFLAEGGFHVSAVYQQGKTQWVSVCSLAGEPLTVVTDAAEALLPSNSGCQVLRQEDQWTVTGLKTGETIYFVSSKQALQEYPITSCPDSFNESCRYGLYQ